MAHKSKVSGFYTDPRKGSSKTDETDRSPVSKPTWPKTKGIKEKKINVNKLKTFAPCELSVNRKYSLLYLVSGAGFLRIRYCLL